MSLYFVCIQFRRMHFFVDNFMRNDLLGALSATPMITKRMSVPYRALVSSRAVTRVVFFGRMLLFEEKFSTNGVLIFLALVFRHEQESSSLKACCSSRRVLAPSVLARFFERLINKPVTSLLKLTSRPIRLVCRLLTRIMANNTSPCLSVAEASQLS
jgi:hypothetical protein